jgi:uncharacterized protein YuzE
VQFAIETTLLYHKCASRNQRGSFVHLPMVAIDLEGISETIEVEIKSNGEVVQNLINDA